MPLSSENVAGHHAVFLSAAVSELIPHCLLDRRGNLVREVTMRYGREEGRLFDTATRWSCAVIYNGNRKELAESNTGLHQPHICRRLHAH